MTDVKYIDRFDYGRGKVVYMEPPGFITGADRFVPEHELAKLRADNERLRANNAGWEKSHGEVLADNEQLRAALTDARVELVSWVTEGEAPYNEGVRQIDAALSACELTERKATP